MQLLREHAQPIRAGKITAVDGSWIFQLFLTEDVSDLVACIGGRLPERRSTHQQVTGRATRRPETAQGPP
ncbi:hypothetical protein [Streptomyces sp. SID13726]|uniref:hypothetical protein n=1 Tax=Streptomyces sp. SID13726 TaxID=2706058 RepID=UPI001940F951|nr:hypothetical protein [Streptomyces sp. SID13726]